MRLRIRLRRLSGRSSAAQGARVAGVDPLVLHVVEQLLGVERVALGARSVTSVAQRLGALARRGRQPRARSATAISPSSSARQPSPRVAPGSAARPEPLARAGLGPVGEHHEHRQRRQVRAPRPPAGRATAGRASGSPRARSASGSRPAARAGSVTSRSSSDVLRSLASKRRRELRVGQLERRAARPAAARAAGGPGRWRRAPPRRAGVPARGRRRGRDRRGRARRRARPGSSC